MSVLSRTPTTQMQIQAGLAIKSFQTETEWCVTILTGIRSQREDFTTAILRRNLVQIVPMSSTKLCPNPE